MNNNKEKNLIVSESMKKAMDKGFTVKNSCQSHIALNFDKLFNDKFTMNENSKTDRIPVFNLPNIKLQVDFLQLVKNNNMLDLVPDDEKEFFLEFVDYMKKNAMCVNCQSCKNDCYNNKAYTQYPSKGIADLRQLYRLLKKPHVVIGEIIQETINSKNVRLNGSGEMHNEFILDVYKRIAKANPDTIYYTYTKNYKLLEGKKLPKNLVVNLSDFGTTEKLNASKELLPKKLNTFKAVTSEEMLAIKIDKIMSKTVCHGESCSQCKLCTTKKGLTIYCEIH